jgi:tetrahedral aminopeptidase
MREMMLNHLKALSEAMAVSGDEGEVRQLIREAAKAHADTIITDAMGNLLVLRKGTAPGQNGLERVMVTAHMDEAGFMVTNGENGNNISIVGVGMSDARYMPAARVWVGKEKKPGVIISPPVHRSKDDSLQYADAMNVDVGESGAAAKAGDRIAYQGVFTQMSPSVVRGKAFDSRPSCALLLALLAGDPFPFDLHAVFTVQAHIKGRGASVAASRLKPQVAIVLRAVNCTDVPFYGDVEEEDKIGRVAMGAGPAISPADPSRLVADRKLNAHIRRVAESAGAPLQLDAQYAGASEGMGISLHGVPTSTLSIPVRYLRSPNALLNLDDLDNTLHLLRASLGQLSSEVFEQ